MLTQFESYHRHIYLSAVDRKDCFGCGVLSGLVLLFWLKNLALKHERIVKHLHTGSKVNINPKISSILHKICTVWDLL